MKVLLFGTGEYYQRYKVWFEDEEILALIDNSKEKQGTYFDGREIISPNLVNEYDYDAIFVLTFAIVDIKNQLIECGVDEKKIHTFYEINNLIYSSGKRKKIETYLWNNDEREIVLLNSDLSLGGPALALFNVALILKEKGHSVVYASMVDGPLRTLLVDNEIPVIVDNNLLAETMIDNIWINDFSLVICNTINYHVFLSNRNTDIPVVWWLHDPLFFYEVANVTALKKIDPRNLKVYAVGPVAKNAIKSFRTDFFVNDLLYGVKDVEIKPKARNNKLDIVHFVTIGFVEPHKGQDVLFDAIEMLQDSIRGKCRFLFVGKNTSLFAKELIKRCENIPEIEFLGVLDREGINSILEETDVLICPSRQDCMPTVCAEAMMHFVPCIVSDVVGTVPYISKNSGLVFKTEDADDLCKKIIWVVENSNKIYDMGVNARRVYDQYFSINALERNIIELVSDNDKTKEI